jgi:hypothetical protein
MNQIKNMAKELAGKKLCPNKKVRLESSILTGVKPVVVDVDHNQSKKKEKS